jgi:hypothetical protein
MPVTIVLILSVLLALSAKRPQRTWPAVLLAVMTGELAYGGALAGFLGSIAFYTTLEAVIFDEGHWASRVFRERRGWAR